MRRVHDDVDRRDLRSLDREHESRLHPAADRPNRAGLAVDERGQGSPGTAFEGVGVAFRTVAGNYRAGIYKEWLAAGTTA